MSFSHCLREHRGKTKTIKNEKKHHCAVNKSITLLYEQPEAILLVLMGLRLAGRYVYGQTKFLKISTNHIIRSFTEFNEGTGNVIIVISVSILYVL